MNEFDRILITQLPAAVNYLLATPLHFRIASLHAGKVQFFIALSPQPHLDGGYTAFGRVVGGLELLDDVTRGTTVWRAREVAVQ